MQDNKNNKMIADELDDISMKINQLDKHKVSDTIAKIHDIHREIEQVARKYDLTTLLAIVDWVDLSTEINDENANQIETLLTEEAYSNWIDVFVSLLRDYNDNLRPVVHQSLTAPKWVVKPSTILLKDIASWIAAIKIEHQNNVSNFDSLNNFKDIEDSLETATEDSDEEDSPLTTSELETSDNTETPDETVSVSDHIASENIIEDQLKKADLASEEAMLQQNVFEEVDQDILEKDYTVSDVSDDLINESFTSEEAMVPLMETEKSSLDDEDFELSNTNPSEINLLNDSELVDDDDNSFKDVTLISEISKIHDALESVYVSSADAFLSKDSFTKHLDKLVLVTENTNLSCIVPVVDWTQRNLLLFQDNSTSDIQQFISSGKSWQWIGNVVKCLNTNNRRTCLDDLTSALMHKEWLEPLDKNDLEELLFGIDSALNGEEIFEEEAVVEEDQVEINNELETSISTEMSSSNVSDDLLPTENTSEEELPELLDNPLVVNEIIKNDDDNEVKESEVIETSGLQMTWDDDTHPELLMVYLEETPSQIEELLPLLDKINKNIADNDEKADAARLAHTIKGGSAVVGITALADFSSHLEELLEHSITSKLNDEILTKLPEIGNCVNDTFKAVQLQGDEPKAFLSLFKLLENYPYDLDEAVSVEDQHIETPEINDMDVAVLNDSATDLAVEDVKDTSSEDINSEFKDTHTEENTEDLVESLIDSSVEDNDSENLVTTDEILTKEDTAEISDIIDDLNDNTFDKEPIVDDIEKTETDTSSITAMASMAAAAFVSKEIIDEVSSDTSDNIEESSDVKVDEIETIVDVEIEANSNETEQKEEVTDKVTTEKSGFNMTWNDDTHPELLMVYLEETPTQINELVPLLNKISENKADADEKHTASRMAHTIKGGSAIVGLTTLSEISYRLETLLDYSVKHQLPEDILETLPKAAACIENLFEEIQMVGEEPDEYFGIFKKLDKFVDSIDDLDDEPLELSSVALPDFILNQNNSTDNVNVESSEILDDDVTSDVSIEKGDTEVTDVQSDADLVEVKAETSETEIDTNDKVEVHTEATSEDAAVTLETETEIVNDDAEETLESEVEIVNEETVEAKLDEDEVIETEVEIVNTIETTKSSDIQEEETLETKTEEVFAEDQHAENSETEDAKVEDSEVNSDEETEIKVQVVEDTKADIIKSEIVETNEVKKSLETESVKLDKLKTREDVNNIIVEIDDIVMNLISHSESADNPAEFVEKCTVELERFELVTELSGYPELSLLSQWCQLNIKSYNRRHKKFIKFIQSNEVWSWVEHVSECLRESDDMSHMSSLSVELMREDWLKAIKMEDLQTVLLALRHLEDTGVSETPEEETKDENVNEVISWDKDVHPELLAVYFQETPDQIDQVAGLLHKISRGESTVEENKEAARIAHTIKGSSGVVGLNQLLELTHHLEDILDYSVNNDISAETADLLSEASDCMESLFETIQNKQAPPEELPSVLKSLSAFSGNLTPADRSSNETSIEEYKKEEAAEEENTSSISPSNETLKPFEKVASSSVDTNEAFIRVPIKVIDKLLNLAGELVTTSNQVSDNLAKTQETNKTIRAQDERVIAMLEDLNKTIEQQEKDQQNLFSSMDNSDFDSLEMDTYNELNSVVSLLSEGILDSQEIDNTLSRQLDELSERLHSLDKLNKTFSDVILSSRMVTIDTIVPRLERIVRQTCRKTNKKAQLVVTGNNLNVDTDILNNLVDPLLHMLRNSIDHGIETPEERVKNGKDETGLIELEFSRDGNNILMTLKDDGAGINPEKIYKKAIEKEIISPDQEFSDSDAINLILQAGFSTQENVTDISGRGVGMDVVNTSIQDLNGTMGIDSNLGKGTSFNLTIPLTLITNTTLLVKVEDNLIAIPTDTIEQIMYQQAATMIKRDDEYYVSHNDVEIKTKALGELLNWPHQLIDENKSYNVLIIKADDKTYAIHVDGIESSREVVVKRLSPWISPAKGVIGACHLNDGGVAPVINLVTVAKTAAANELLNTNSLAPKQIIKPNVKKKILVVDDSLSNRKALSLIIERTEFDVATAVDGLDALRVMNENNIDLVFTDLEMPRMNGLELTQSIRAWNDKKKTPIVMITSRTTNKHRELANKAGVDDYLTKPVETDTLLKSIDTWLEVKEPMEV